MTTEERAKRLYGSIAAEVGRGGSQEQVRLIVEAIREAIAEEREACAMALDSLYERGPSRGNTGWSQAWGSGVLDAAVAIRARGDA